MLSDQMVSERDHLDARSSALHSQANSLAAQVQSDALSVHKSTAFFADADDRLRRLRARASVFSELLDASSEYVDGLSNPGGQSVPWHHIAKLRTQMHVVEEEAPNEDESLSPTSPANALELYQEDEAQVVIQVAAARPVARGKCREGKGTRETVERAFERLLQEANGDSSENWQNLAQNKRQRWQLYKAKGSMGIWKAEALFLDLSIEAVAGVLQSIELRSAWDPSLHNYKLLQKVNDSPHQAYIHILAKGQMQMQDREMVEFRTLRRMDDGSHHIVFQGCSHGRAPESDRAVRAECILTGFVIEPWRSEDGEQQGCRLFMYSHVDYKGAPALALLREWLKKGPQNWFNAFVQECHRWQAKEVNQALEAAPNYPQIQSSGTNQEGQNQLTIML